MANPTDAQDLARRVLDAGARIDFDPDFRREVAVDPYGALVRAGIPELVATVLAEPDEEVTAFADRATAVAARAHAWGMDLLRRVGGGPAEPDT